MHLSAVFAAAVCATLASASADKASNPHCYAVPILVISPKTPLPVIGCVTHALPANDCMKEVVAAELTTIDSGSEWHCLDDLETAPKLASHVNYRGDSTLRLIKHQMSLKLDTPTDFFGLPADHKWSLHGPYFDASLLRNHVAHHLYRQTGRYSSRTKHIAVYITNPAGVNEYKGLYLLLETVAYGPNRVGLAESTENCTAAERASGGWGWKMDPLEYGVYSPNIVKNMYTSQFGGGRPVLMYPPGETTSQAMRDAFVKDTGFLPAFHKYLWEGMLRPEGLAEHIDLGSFVDYMLHTEWSLNQDAYSRSMFFFKDRDHPIEAGPVWDFNLAFGAGTKAGAQAWLFQSHEMWKRLTCNYKFTSLLIARWKALRADVWADDKLTAFVAQEKAPLDKTLAKCRDNNWMSSNPSCAHVALSTRGSYTAQVNQMVSATVARAKWMDAHIESLYQPLNARVCMGVGRIPAFNCGPNGNDNGCLRDPTKYFEDVEVPAVRPINHAKCSGPAPTDKYNQASVDPCWVMTGRVGRAWWLTPTCNGFGWCAQGPGATCKCTDHRTTFDCSPNKPHVAVLMADAVMETASAPMAAIAAGAVVAVVAVIAVVRRRRQQTGYATL